MFMSGKSWKMFQLFLVLYGSMLVASMEHVGKMFQADSQVKQIVKSGPVCWGSVATVERHLITLIL